MAKGYRQILCFAQICKSLSFSFLDGDDFMLFTEFFPIFIQLKKTRWLRTCGAANVIKMNCDSSKSNSGECHSGDCDSGECASDDRGSPVGKESKHLDVSLAVIYRTPHDSKMEDAASAIAEKVIAVNVKAVKVSGENVTAVNVTAVNGTAVVNVTAENVIAEKCDRCECDSGRGRADGREERYLFLSLPVTVPCYSGGCHSGEC